MATETDDHAGRSTDVDIRDPIAPSADVAGHAPVTPTIGDRVRTRLDPVWRDYRIGLAAAVGTALLWGLLAGIWMPRGPATSAEALWSLSISLAVGAVGGLAMRSRWAMLAIPLTFVVVYELMRMDLSGPTVDSIATSLYGLIAFTVGRGFHALVALVPMLLGAAVGAGLARHLGTPGDGDRGRSIGRYARRTIAVLTAVGMVALSVLIARPAGTDRITDANGAEIPGSIAELTTIDVNGHELALMIRGNSIENPVLLFLAGGPGGSEMGSMRNHLAELEEHFTVVTWDQRGAGKSYPELDPTDTITLEGAVDDTILVTDQLRQRFDQSGIYLLGQSWGTTLGVMAVQRRPELYRALIGTGQMVSQLATDTIFYEDTLAWARTNGHDGLAADLESIGPPPYDDMLDYETALSKEQDVYAYDHTPNSEGMGQMSENLFADEYTLVDSVHILGAFMDSFAALYPQLQDIDFREDATDFEVPVFFVQGAHEADGRAEVFADWYPSIDAPVKDLEVLETSGHRPLFEQPDEFVDYMVDTVLAQTTTTR